MRYTADAYMREVQAAFARRFHDSFDPQRDEMRDYKRKVITTSGALSHEVRTGLDTADSARLRIYSYRKCIAQWWRVGVGEGVRLFGWNAPPTSSMTTNRHIGDLMSPSVYGGIKVILREPAKGSFLDDVGMVPPLDELLVAYDHTLEKVGHGFIPAHRSVGGFEVIFTSDDIGVQTVEMWRDDNPSNARQVEVSRMNYRSMLAQYQILSAIGLVGYKTPRICVWQSPTQGYFVNAREKVVGYWKVPEVSNKEV